MSISHFPGRQAQDSILLQEIELSGASSSVSKDEKIIISAKIVIDTQEAAVKDDLKLTLDYKLLHDTLVNAVQHTDFASFGSLGRTLAKAAFTVFPALPSLALEIRTKQVEYTLGYQGKYHTLGRSLEHQELFIRDWHAQCLIGVYDWERNAPQDLTFSIHANILPGYFHHSSIRQLTNRISHVIKTSSFHTLEALASEVAANVLQNFNANKPVAQLVRVLIKKPRALPSGVAAVEVVRTADQYPSPRSRSMPVLGNSTPSLAVLSMGSNIQPRFEHINRALQLLEKNPSDVRILDSSFLYDTTPMYVTDQDRFANCALLIESNLTPLELLVRVKQVEEEVGRVATFRHGPRVVDLDIVFYDQLVMDNTDSSRSDRGSEKGDLIIPHPRAEEREFVLRPIADILPTFVHPESQLTVTELLTRVTDIKSSMQRIVPFVSGNGRSIPRGEYYWAWGNQTFLMGILNATPDSFSDGGRHLDVENALEYARTCVQESVDVIDIGGYSTRPGAANVSQEEEIRRVTSVIRRIREEGFTTPISVDTFRATVAQAAVEAGADMINDVFALDHEPEMRTVVRNLGIPIVLMHSRGDAGKNKEYEGDVTDVVREELGAKVQRALDAGIRRWNLIVDPGIGFSKKVEDNCALLRTHLALTHMPGEGASSGRRHSTLREAWEANKKYPMRNMPTLIGSSRKSFLGSLLGGGNAAALPSSERIWATAATVAAAIQQGTDIVRVHDVREMRQVKVVADAIWRVAKRII